MFKNLRRSISTAALAVIFLGLLLMPSRANATQYCAASVGNTLSACADFVISGTNLVVTLTNTNANDVLNPAQVLTGVFFNYGGAVTLTSTSAVLAGGSTVFYDTDGQPAGGVVGGEWAYATGLAGAPGGATKGISSSGLGLFGGATFPGADLESPSAVDGVQYGILSAGDNTATGNGGITGSGGLIKSSVVFTLTCSIANCVGLNVAALTNVSFQYGTDLSEPNIRNTPSFTPDGSPSKIPEPASLLLLGFGILAMGRSLKRFGK